MKRKRKALIIPLLAITAVYVGYCKTATNLGEYRYMTYFEGSSISSEKSDQKIANDTTWQLFFNLKKAEKCIKIVFSSFLKVETLKEPLKSEVNTYFIIEKIVDITRYKANDKSIFYEMARNFDLRWNASPLIVVCADAADPLKNLDPGLYRIRFTGIKSTNFHYRIEIFSAQEEAKFGF